MPEDNGRRSGAGLVATIVGVIFVLLLVTYMATGGLATWLTYVLSLSLVIGVLFGVLWLIRKR
jgi:uncharacterized protein (DUF983 family)